MPSRQDMKCGKWFLTYLKLKLNTTVVTVKKGSFCILEEWKTY
jgi:hypothetical protein